MSAVSHADMANAIRFLSADAVQKANSGHPGMPMGMADVATVLFTKFLKFDAASPRWPDRDRFVLSAGHGSMLLYSLSYLVGYADMDIDQLRNFRQLGSRTAGHPEYGHVLAAETTTGPLGQGLANAVGLALGERLMAARHGDGVVDHHTYVIAGDGCLMEGISQEAISLAGHLKLSKLIVLWDDNNISIDGQIGLASSEDMALRFQACGWETLACDGHDPEAIEAAISKAKASDKPTLVACKTVIGKGAPTMQGTSKVHGSPLGDAEIAAAREALGWTYAPFEVPDDILGAWRAAGCRGAAARAEWEGRRDALDGSAHETFNRAVAGDLPAEFADAIEAAKAKLIEDKPKVATRKASQMALDVLTGVVPELLGGSADLTGSNLTKGKGQVSVAPGDFAGSYIHYGVREHGMGSVMNGLALHGGLIPYGGTFLVFADYMRPAIRMASLMGLRVVYVLTHDSIGLGEDGPTHQPVEHMASLRAIPNLWVFRPADALETLECWQLSVERTDGPSALALSRQNLPALRTEPSDGNLCGKGAYVLAGGEGKRDVTLIATGSEVEIAMAARELLAADGVSSAVVSMPCWELFEAQPETYRDEVLGPRRQRVAVEAASVFGWDRWVEGSAIVGMTGFGASGPAEALYTHFGITAEAVAKAAKDRLEG
ncbi:transketolase [Rhodospirillum sp. A1_3_36]|uniref:transketolase n=1 Tax=Rhodospirillum sp. A1_3_36 TaxID=3391666 RepID=UPI0039A59DC4